jgi:hypothetical protein
VQQAHVRPFNQSIVTQRGLTRDDQLHLLPGWLRWLETFKTVRALAGFGVHFWYYAQIYAIGQTGKTDLGMSVFAAMQQVNAMNKKLLAGRTH